MVTQYKKNRASMGTQSGNSKGNNKNVERNSKNDEQIGSKPKTQENQGSEGPSVLCDATAPQPETGKQKKQNLRPHTEYDKMTSEQQAEAERLWSSYLVEEDAQEPKVTTLNSKEKPTG